MALEAFRSRCKFAALNIVETERPHLLEMTTAAVFFNGDFWSAVREYN
jgi:hypothetical protein